MKILQNLLILVGWFFLVAITSYIWTAFKVMSDNSMSKHKKVCDLCFRNIKMWNEQYKKSAPKSNKE